MIVAMTTTHLLIEHRALGSKQHSFLRKTAHTTSHASKQLLQERYRMTTGSSTIHRVAITVTTLANRPKFGQCSWELTDVDATGQ